jgi:hypothetical protein
VKDPSLTLVTVPVAATAKIAEAINTNVVERNFRILHNRTPGD